MPDREPGRDRTHEQELERELRELGAWIEYPPTPDLSRAVRRQLDEEDAEQPARRGGLWPSLSLPRWAAAAALALVFIVALPTLSPTLRATVADWFGSGQGASSGQEEPAPQSARTPGDAALPRSEKSSASSERASGGILASGPRFRSLDLMVAKADLVVLGTVTDVRPGKVEAEGTPDEVQNLNTVVRVDEALKGSAPAGTVTVTTLELAYGGPQNTEWRRPRERVLLFLSHSREQPGLFIPAGISYDQTAYVLRDDDLIAASTFNDPLSKRVASLSLPELRREVEEAVGRARGAG